MQKYWLELTKEEQSKITAYWGKQQAHAEALKRNNLLEIYCIDTNESMLVCKKTLDNVDSIKRTFDKHNTDYIEYLNVIFRLERHKT